MLEYDSISPPNPDLWLGPCRFFAGERGALSNYWSVEAIIDRGYAFATYHDVELDADRNDENDGIHGLLKSASIESAGDDEGAAWGTITDDDEISMANIGGMTQYRRRSGHSLDPEYWRVILDVAEVTFGSR